MVPPPAYFSKVTIEHSYTATIPDTTIIPISKDATAHAETIIPPSKFHVARIAGTIAQNNFNTAFGMKKIYVWGNINYIDAFGDKHFTEFQLMHHITNINQFAFCAVGNRTDDKLSSLSIAPHDTEQQD